MKQITMKDVARQAGVTQPMVSYILNNNPKVKISDETRKRVLEIADKLNYKPHRFAQLLRTGRTHMIGVQGGRGASFQFGHHYLSNVYYGVSDLCAEKRYKMLVDNFIADPAGTDGHTLYQERLVDGMVYVLFGNEISAFKRYVHEQLQKTGLPFAVIHSLSEDLGCLNVGLDTRRGGREAALHLYGHGYDTVGFIKFERGNVLFDELELGYLDAVKQTGGHEPLIWKIRGEYYTEGYALGDELIRENTDLPRALVVAGDAAAYGLRDRLQEAGIRVPEDLALIGFGDEVNQQLIRTGLTTVSQPSREKGKAAAELLFEAIESGNMTPQFRLLKPELMIRKSCGC